MNQAIKLEDMKEMRRNNMRSAGLVAAGTLTALLAAAGYAGVDRASTNYARESVVCEGNLLENKTSEYSSELTRPSNAIAQLVYQTTSPITGAHMRLTQEYVGKGVVDGGAEDDFLLFVPKESSYSAIPCAPVKILANGAVAKHYFADGSATTYSRK